MEWRHSPVEPQSFECRFVHEIPHENKCDWVQNTSDCHDYGNSIFEYVDLYYCTFNITPAWSYVGLVLFVLILIILFTILGTTADDFFCPALAVVSKVLHMSDTVAGVTILAFGNGAPDLFTSIAAPVGNVKMVYAQLLGAGMFVTTVIPALIMITCPFRLSPFAFVKDCAFYIISVFYIYWIFDDEVMTTYEVSGLLLIYLAYIIFVVLASWLARHKAKIAESRMGPSNSEDVKMVYKNKRGSMLFGDRALSVVPEEDETVDAPSSSRRRSLNRKSVFMEPTTSRSTTSTLPPESLPRGRSYNNFTKLDIALQQERNQLLRQSGQNDLAKAEQSGFSGQRSYDGRIIRPKQLLQEFLYDIKPFGKDEWDISNCFLRFLMLLKAPIVFVMTLVIPLVNYTVLNNGWSRLLNTIHCTTMPLMVMFITDLAWVSIYKSFQLWMLVLPIGVIFSLIVLFTSGPNPPKYHDAFAFLGFIGSIAIIYRVANEVVCVLSAIGVAVKISDTTLGLTALAWGNSMGDLIADVAIAKAGYPRMGFAACFGGPLFNTLMGMGLKFMIALVDEGETERDMNYGDVGPVCTFYLLLSLGSSIIVLPLLGFQARRSYGIYLIILYLVFMVFCVLCETSTIHPYGTHHTL